MSAVKMLFPIALGVLSEYALCKMMWMVWRGGVEGSFYMALIRAF